MGSDTLCRDNARLLVIMKGASGWSRWWNNVLCQKRCHQTEHRKAVAARVMADYTTKGGASGRHALPPWTPGSLRSSSIYRRAWASLSPYTPTPASHRWTSGRLGVSRSDEVELWSKQRTCGRLHYKRKHIDMQNHCVTHVYGRK